MLVVLCLSIAMSILSGCGSSGGDPAAPAQTDLSGVWQTTEVINGPPAPKASIVPNMLNIIQNGNTITGRSNMFSFTGTFDGTNINCTGTMLTTTISLALVLADDNTFGGTMTVNTGGAQTTYQITFAKRGTPAGTLAFTGTMDGTDLSINSTTAFGAKSGSSNNRWIYSLSHDRAVQIYISTVGDVAATTYTLVNNPVNAGEARMNLYHIEGTGDQYGDSATGGTLTITSLTDDSMVGTFNVTGWGGVAGSLTGGSFNVQNLVFLTK